MTTSVVLEWNGKQLPDELRQLPERRYVIEPVDDAPPLTDAEEEGIEQALASVSAGKGINRRTPGRGSIGSWAGDVAFAPEAIEDRVGGDCFPERANLQAAARLSDRILTVVARLAEGEFDGPDQELRRTGPLTADWLAWRARNALHRTLALPR